MQPAGGSDADRSLKNFDGGAAHAWHQFFAALRDFYFDVARAAHFFALQNAEGVAGGELAMLHEIGTERTGSGARCGIFVNFPRKHATREHFAVGALSEAVRHRRIRYHVWLILLFGTAYFLIARERNPPWLSFATSCFDVTLGSAGLAAFFLFNEPHAAVNSRAVFEGSVIAIGATSLRYDRGVCMVAGILTLTEYLTIVTYAASRWDLNSPAFSPFRYGMFSWPTQISRLIMPLAASVLSIVIVSRAERLLLLSTTDQLTGRFNRGYVDDRFKIELVAPAVITSRSPLP